MAFTRFIAEHLALRLPALRYSYNSCMKYWTGDLVSSPDASRHPPFVAGMDRHLARSIDLCIRVFTRRSSLPIPTPKQYIRSWCWNEGGLRHGLLRTDKMSYSKSVGFNHLPWCYFWDAMPTHYAIPIILFTRHTKTHQPDTGTTGNCGHNKYTARLVERQSTQVLQRLCTSHL